MERGARVRLSKQLRGSGLTGPKGASLALLKRKDCSGANPGSAAAYAGEHEIHDPNYVGDLSPRVRLSGAKRLIDFQACAARLGSMTVGFAGTKSVV